MGRHRNLNRKPDNFSTTERRWIHHELKRLSNDAGVVYERDLPAWLIPRLMRGHYVKRLERGVLQVTKKE